MELEVVAGPGIEPGTQGFSGKRLRLQHFDFKHVNFLLQDCGLFVGHNFLIF